MERILQVRQNSLMTFQNCPEAVLQTRMERTSWDDLVGILDYVATKDLEYFKPFKDAREFAQAVKGLKSKKEWRMHILNQATNCRQIFHVDPRKTYTNEFKGYGRLVTILVLFLI